MDKYQTNLDTLFHALGDPTRRAVINRLGLGAASVSELAQPFDMALPSFMKHIRVLEQSGWITTQKQGRVRTCTVDQTQLSAAMGWLEAQRRIWEDRTDRLEKFVTSEDQGSSQ